MMVIIKSQPQTLLILIAICIFTGVRATNNTTPDNLPPPSDDGRKTVLKSEESQSNSIHFSKVLEPVITSETDTESSSKAERGKTISNPMKFAAPGNTEIPTKNPNNDEIKTKDISKNETFAGASAGAGSGSGSGADSTAYVTDISTNVVNQQDAVTTTPEFKNDTIDTTTTTTKGTTTPFAFTFSLPANLVFNIDEKAQAAAFKKRFKGDPKAEKMYELQQAGMAALKLGLAQYFATMKGRTATTPTTTTTTTPEPEPLYIEFMEPCKKVEEEKCSGYPDVKCYDMNEFRTDVPEHVFVCSCNYLHTLHIASVPFNGTSTLIHDTECVRNVYAPCSIGTTELKCGDNMDCITDTLGISTMKFCHCRPGFAPVPNYLGIPAFCRPIVWEEPEVEDVEIESAASELEQVRTTVKILILAHFSICIINKML